MGSRFFRHGELPLVLLELLAQRPMHGYELMAELTRLFGPAYRPSPGTIYPAIEALSAEGLVAGSADDSRTVFRTTPEGDRARAKRADLVAAVELRTGARFGRGESLEGVLTRFTTRLMRLSGRVDPVAVQTILDRAATEIDELDAVHNTTGGIR